MSYDLPRNREQFENTILSLLGSPILEINVTPAQLSTQVNMAIEFHKDFHSEFSILEFVKHRVTQSDIDNKYVELPTDILDICSVLQPGMKYGAGVFSTAKYAVYSYMLNNMGTLTSRPLAGYVMSMSNLEELSQTLSNKITFRYNPYQNRCYIDCNYSQVTVGDYFIFECYFAAIGSEIWGSRTLTELSRELVRRQWGENLSKFKGNLSLNGVEFNGEKMVADADIRIKEIKEEIIYRYSVPSLPIIY
jgi:hypothetical protein